MGPEVWIEELAQELAARGFSPHEIADATAEATLHLQLAETSPLTEFGPPAVFAAALAEHAAPANNASDRSRSMLPSRSANQQADRPLVEVSKICKRFRSHQVLTDVDLRLHRGTVVLLMGPNGVGKSTLLSIIAGLTQADSGGVTVAGTIGYSPHSGGLLPLLTAKEHFAYFGVNQGMAPEQAQYHGRLLARELNLEVDDAPVVAKLSGGAQQKLSVILAALHHPDVLLLDEPYQAMDHASSARFWDQLWVWRDQGRSAIVVTHSRDAIERADTVVELSA